MMKRKQTRFMTLEDRRREQNRQLDRGKKLAAGCLIGAALILYGWSAQPAFFSMMVGCVLLACALIAQLRQVPIAPPLRLLLGLGFGVTGAWFAARGVLQLLIA